MLYNSEKSALLLWFPDLFIGWSHEMWPIYSHQDSNRNFSASLTQTHARTQARARAHTHTRTHAHTRTHTHEGTCSNWQYPF